MSDNKHKETPNGYDLDGYERLKRRNRRRLVLASGLVVASGMLFGLALTSGDDKNSPFKEAPVGQSQVKTADEPSKAVVLEPNKEDVAAAEEAARYADAETPNKPQNAGDEEDNNPHKFGLTHIGILSMARFQAVSAVWRFCRLRWLEMKKSFCR